MFTIARAELLGLMRDGRFRALAAALVLLLTGALLIGAKWHGERLAEWRAAQGESNAQWLRQGDKNPHSAAHYGNYAFKSSGPLAFFDPGVDAYTGGQVFMEAHKQNLAILPAAQDAGEIARFGELSGATILQTLVPLFIVLLAFTAFAGERERGTLRQLLALGVAPRRLLWGKCLGIAAAVALVLVPCLLVGAIAIGQAGTAQGAARSAELAPRAALLALAYLTYFSIFLFVTLAVSARARNARTALAVAVGFWAFGSFLAPKAAVELSRELVASPSLGELQAAIRAEQKRGHDGRSPFEKAEAYKQSLFERHGVDEVSALPVYWPAARMQFLEELDEPIFDRHYGALIAAYHRQRRAQDAFGVAAPLMSLRSVSMGLAGTAFLDHERFLAAAEAYRRRMVETMNGYLARAAVDLNASYSASNFMIADESVFATVPPFAYEPPSLAETLRDNAASLALLALWAAASVAAALFAVRNLSERS